MTSNFESGVRMTPINGFWIAGVRKSTRYDRLYSQSVGLGITDTVREHARRICDLQREEHVIEGELRELLADSRFDHQSIATTDYPLIV